MHKDETSSQRSADDRQPTAGEEQMTRKLEIDWGELSAAFQSGFSEMQYYLDLETGKVVMVTDEARWYLEEPPDEELHEWQQQMIQEARQVEKGYGTRYIQVPQQDSHEGYRDMERFAATVRDRHLQDRLWRAIQGRGAFRYFKDVLYDHPDEQERWFAFSDRCVHERMLDWLETQDIEPTNPIESPDVPEPVAEEPASRDVLIEELTLLLIYLTSWEEHPVPDSTVRCAWKGYLFEVLDVLEEKGLIERRRRARSLILTEEGIRRAQELEERYSQ
jgi:hypothetical protein